MLDKAIFQAKHSAENGYCYMWPKTELQPPCDVVQKNGQSLQCSIRPRHVCILNVPFEKDLNCKYTFI